LQTRIDFRYASLRAEFRARRRAFCLNAFFADAVIGMDKFGANLRIRANGAN
jgi:hypothetical protein